MEIYKITNLQNKKVYVGLTTRTSQERFKEHLNLSRYSNYAIHRAIRKYGKENFVIETIEKCEDFDSLVKKESYWITVLDSMNPLKGYNMINQEDNVKIINEEVKNKISESQKERFRLMSNEEKIELYKKTSKSRQGIKRNKDTKYIGVSKARFERYACDTSYLGIRYRKLFLSEVEAAEGYDRIMLYMYGEDARLNFPEKRDSYLQEDLEFYFEWFTTDVHIQGRPAKRLYKYAQLLQEAKIKAKEEIIKYNIPNVEVTELTYLYNGKINPNFLLKYEQ